MKLRTFNNNDESSIIIDSESYGLYIADEVYDIIYNVANLSVLGEDKIFESIPAVIKFYDIPGYLIPRKIEVTNAKYKYASGVLTIYNPRGNVTVTASGVAIEESNKYLRTNQYNGLLEWAGISASEVVKDVLIEGNSVVDETGAALISNETIPETTWDNLSIGGNAATATKAQEADHATNADIADKLGEVNIGTTAQPIYLDNGVATVCIPYNEATVNKAVKANVLYSDEEATTISIGAETQPVYFKDGIPIECIDYSNASVKLSASTSQIKYGTVLPESAEYSQWPDGTIFFLYEE